MNEEAFNMSVRKFLKNTGVNSQREIEHSILDALKTKKIKLDETISVVMTLKIHKTELNVKFEGDIKLL